MQNLNINRGSSSQAQATTTLHVIINKNENKLEHRVPITERFLLALLPSDSWGDMAQPSPNTSCRSHPPAATPLERDRETKEVSDRSA